MEDYTKNAIERIEWLIEQAINDCGDIANEEQIEPVWVLEKFRDKVVTKINKKIKEQN